MSKHLNFMRATALALLVGTPALAEDTPDITAIVATVNGQAITLGEMIAVRDALPTQYQSLPADVLFQGILDQLVQQTVLAQQLGGKVPTRVEIALRNEKRALLAAEGLQEVASREFTEAEIQAAYDERYASFEGEPEYNASHILVETEEEALAIREDLLAGADFAETAKTKSTGPSGPSGGELGWFGPGRMVKPFEEAVAVLQVGEISPPFETQFGWHVVKLNDMRRQQAPSVDAVREEMLSEMRGKAIDAYVTGLTAAADVDNSGATQFDPSVIHRSELLDADKTGE